MAHRLIMHRLDRITLVRKGRGRAKHPELREGVVEVVKAVPKVPGLPLEITVEPTPARSVPLVQSAPLAPTRPSAMNDYPHLGRLALGRVPHEE